MESSGASTSFTIAILLKVIATKILVTSRPRHSQATLPHLVRNGSHLLTCGGLIWLGYMLQDWLLRFELFSLSGVRSSHSSSLQFRVRGTQSRTRSRPSYQCYESFLKFLQKVGITLQRSRTLNFYFELHAGLPVFHDLGSIQVLIDR